MQLFRKDQKLTGSWDLVRPSLNLLRENIWPVFYLAFLPGLVTLVGVVLFGSTSPVDVENLTGSQVAGLALALFGGVWSLLAYPGFIYMQLQAVRGNHPDTAESFRKGLSRLLPFALMSIAGGILIVIGLLALLIPGLILIRGFYLSQYYIVDETIGPIEALKKSFNESKPHAGYLWGTIGVEVFFSFIGSVLQRIPVFGYLFSLGANLVYAFGPALRYQEVTTKTSEQQKV